MAYFSGFKQTRSKMLTEIKERQRRGRQSDSLGTLIGVRLQQAELDALDGLRRGEGDLPTRPEMLRRLLQKATTPRKD